MKGGFFMPKPDQIETIRTALNFVLNPLVGRKDEDNIRVQMSNLHEALTSLPHTPKLEAAAELRLRVQAAKEAGVSKAKRRWVKFLDKIANSYLEDGND